MIVTCGILYLRITLYPSRIQAMVDFRIHHIEAIERGGGVYNLDNLIILAPRTHTGIHNPQVFVPAYRP